MAQREQTDDLGDAIDNLIAAHHTLLQEVVRENVSGIEVSVERAEQSWRLFIIRLIERHTSMAAQATLSLTRPHTAELERHSREIEALKLMVNEIKRRLNALEDHSNRRG